MEVSIKRLVDEATKKASVYSLKCEELISSHGLERAMEYAKSVGIAPPQCSITAQSTNADRQRAKAIRMLSETKWWSRRLKNKAIQDFENEQRKLGLVTNLVSDELEKYHKANQ